MLPFIIDLGNDPIPDLLLELVDPFDAVSDGVSFTMSFGPFLPLVDP